MIDITFTGSHRVNQRAAEIAVTGILEVVASIRGWDIFGRFGCARGVDAAAKAVFERLGLEYSLYRAGWHRYGRRAGTRRNNEMVLDIRGRKMLGRDQICFGFPCPRSSGTYHMMGRCRGVEVPTLAVTTFMQGRPLPREWREAALYVG